MMLLLLLLVMMMGAGAGARAAEGEGGSGGGGGGTHTGYVWFGLEAPGLARGVRAGVTGTVMDGEGRFMVFTPQKMVYGVLPREVSGRILVEFERLCGAAASAAGAGAGLFDPQPRLGLMAGDGLVPMTLKGALRGAGGLRIQPVKEPFFFFQNRWGRELEMENGGRGLPAELRVFLRLLRQKLLDHAERSPSGGGESVMPVPVGELRKGLGAPVGPKVLR